MALVVKNTPASAGDIRCQFNPWVRFLGQEDPLEEGNPLQYSGLENPHGQRNLEGCSQWGRKESDMTERLSTQQTSSKQMICVKSFKTQQCYSTMLKNNIRYFSNSLSAKFTWKVWNRIFLFYLYYFLAMQCGMWDSSYPTRG